VVDPIRAAGGVVWRDDGVQPLVALVHRDRYGDWSLPKGKLHAGECELTAAVREVREETGLTVAVTRRVRRVEYAVDGAPKTVMFWAMRRRGGDFEVNDEVDDLVWLPVPEAHTRVSHDSDRSVLDAFTAVAVPEAVVALVRHAKAGKRSEWFGDDRRRPLDRAGRRQASALASFLAAFAPARIVSADRTRCVQTVEPLAEAVGLPVEIVPAFADEAHLDDPAATRAELFALAESVPSAVLCSQGTAIPNLVADLARRNPPASTTTRKGAAWVLAFAAGEVVSADYYAPAAR
jgi:8-oxo-dGTP diphosphatase